MDYKELIEQVMEYLSNCEQMRYGEMVGAPWPYNYDGPMVYTKPDAILLEQAVSAITDLLARAEAAEAELEQKEKYYCQMFDALAATDSMELTETKKKLKAAEARAEKADMERDEYFKHLQGLCFCCAHRKDGFDCHVKCYGHKRGSAWVYAGPREEE